MDSNSGLDAYIASLKSRIWKTKGSRFNAARRLKNNYQFSLSSISILSIYGIAIPSIQDVLRDSQCQKVDSIYSAISLILSVFTLTISLLEGAKNYQIRSEKLHNNAVEISNLEKKLDYLLLNKSGNANFLQQLGNLSDRYEKLIKECPENHEPEDYDLFMTQNKTDFGINRYRELYIKIKLIVINYWLYIFVLGIPPILFLLRSSC